MYHSIIIEESLKNPQVLKNYKILRTKFESKETPSDVDWHLHIVEIFDPERAIKEIQNVMLSDKPYYFHIYDEGKKLIVIFKNKIFNLDPNNKKGWEEARAYGAERLNIPMEQLDFYPSRISEEEGWFYRYGSLFNIIISKIKGIIKAI